MEREGNTTCQTAIWHAVLRFLKALFAFVVTDRKEFWNGSIYAISAVGRLVCADGSGGIRHPAAGEHLVCCRCTGGLSRSLFRASPVVQIVLFVVISVVLLIFTRPIVRRIFSFGIKDTNNQEIGRIAVVIQTVDPIHNTGRVRLDGVDWIAVSQDGTVIPENTSVRIEAISGTKLLVSRLPQTEEQTVNN